MPTIKAAKQITLIIIPIFTSSLDFLAGLWLLPDVSLYIVISKGSKHPKNNVIFKRNASLSIFFIILRNQNYGFIYKPYPLKLISSNLNDNVTKILTILRMNDSIDQFLLNIRKGRHIFWDNTIKNLIAWWYIFTKQANRKSSIV